MAGTTCSAPAAGTTTSLAAQGATSSRRARATTCRRGGPGDDLFLYGWRWGPYDEEEYDGDAGLDRLVYEAPDRGSLLDARPDVHGYGFATGGLSFRSIERIELRGGLGRDRAHLGDGHDLATGGPGDDRIRGLGGDDEIAGGPGRDRLSGGAGSDLILGDEGGRSGGSDRIHGGAGDDLIHADGGDDRAAGGRGEDVVHGGRGRDRLSGGDGDDRLLGGEGSDRLLGGAGDDRLSGGSGADRLRGGTGHDDLEGGSGADRLHGGAGADAFVFRQAWHSPAGRGADRVDDFEAGLDILDLGGIDADVWRPGDQAARFVGTDRFDGAAGELRYDVAWGVRVVQLDRDGDRRADLEIELDGTGDLWASDFVL